MKLSIIIVSYNTKKLLQDCLGSFYKDLPTDYEVIVVDNASEDGSVSAVKKKFPQVKIIENKKNTGYATANNQGIKKAKGEYYLLLNSDTLSSIKSFKKLVEFLDQNPKIGIVSPKLLNADKSIQQNGGALPNLFNVFAWQFFLDEIPLLTHFFNPYQLEDPEFYLKTRKTGWVSGASIMIRQSVVKKIGLLDEKIFMYAEDIDWCLRARTAGYEVWTLAESQIIHIGQGSGKKISAIVGEYKGIKYLFSKHHPNYNLLVKIILSGGALLRAIVYRIIGDKENYANYSKVFALVR